MTRFIITTTIFIVCALVAPYALDPAMNSADLVFWALFIWWLIRVTCRAPVIPPEHPDTFGSLDLLEREHRRTN